MPIPNPEPGLVISHAFLWHHEHRAGREEGQKDRPSAMPDHRLGMPSEPATASFLDSLTVDARLDR
jgi:hypothetical protein